MALTVEDGSGVSGADTFATVADLDADCIAYFGATIPDDGANLEAALRRAFAFMAALPWVAGAWPVFGGAIPAQVRIAQSVLARAEAKKPGVLSPSVTLAGGKVLTEVKGVRWQVLGDAATVEESRPVVTMAMDLLKPWLAVNPAQDKYVPFGLRSFG